MKNPRPRVQIPALMMGCIVGEEDPRKRGTRRKKVDLSWNLSISPTIRGRMKKFEYSWLSLRGPGGVPVSPAMLLTGRGSALTRFRGSLLFPGRGSGLAMLVRSRGMREGSMGPH
jgi:hypothetical protein